MKLVCCLCHNARNDFSAHITNDLGEEILHICSKCFLKNINNFKRKEEKRCHKKVDTQEQPIGIQERQQKTLLVLRKKSNRLGKLAEGLRRIFNFQKAHSVGEGKNN